MKPIIGITVEPKRDPGNSRTRGTLTLNWNYPEAIAAAGGLPMLIPPTADMEQVAKLIHTSNYYQSPLQEQLDRKSVV